MMIAMVAHPHNGIARENDGGAGGEEKLEPLRHFETAVSQIAMEIKRGADAAPEKKREQDRQVIKMKAGEETDEPEQLQPDEDNKDEELNFFAFKHGAAAARVRAEINVRL